MTVDHQVVRSKVREVAPAPALGDQDVAPDLALDLGPEASELRGTFVVLDLVDQVVLVLARQLAQVEIVHGVTDAVPSGRYRQWLDAASAA